MTLGRLTYQTRTDDCYDLLKAGILRLDLAPGSTVDELDLAAQLGVSKTPIREAVARLSGEGLIVAMPGRKSHVAGLAVETISEVYRVRMLLESSSLRDLTPFLTSSDLRELQELIHRSTEALERDDLPGFVAANEGFHELLIQRTGNHCLMAIAKRLFEQADRVRAAIFRTEQQEAQHDLSRRGLQSHQAIHDALSQRNADRAADLMRADIQMFLDAVTTPEMQEAFRRLGSRP